eukprot:1148873-Prymnesium_polylepis.1
MCPSTRKDPSLPGPFFVREQRSPPASAHDSCERRAPRPSPPHQKRGPLAPLSNVSRAFPCGPRRTARTPRATPHGTRRARARCTTLSHRPTSCCSTPLLSSASGARRCTVSYPRIAARRPRDGCALGPSRSLARGACSRRRARCRAGRRCMWCWARSTPRLCRRLCSCALRSWGPTLRRLTPRTPRRAKGKHRRAPGRIGTHEARTGAHERSTHTAAMARTGAHRHAHGRVGARTRTRVRSLVPRPHNESPAPQLHS